MGLLVPVQRESRSPRTTQYGAAHRLSEVHGSGDDTCQLATEGVAQALSSLDSVGKLVARQFIGDHRVSPLSRLGIDIFFHCSPGPATTAFESRYQHVPIAPN